MTSGGARRWKEATMQPSEMTNVQIADYILSLQSDVDGFPFNSNEIIREAAKRLLTDGDDDISKDAEIAELRERLKIAEVALEKIDNMCDGDMCKHFNNTHHCSACRYLDECQTGVAHAALSAIRDK